MTRPGRFFVDFCTDTPLDIDAEGVRRVEARYNELFVKSPRTIAKIAAAVVALIIVGWLIGMGLGELVEFLGGSRVLVGLTAGLMTPAFLAVMWLALVPRVLRRGMRQALRDCGYDICNRCAYDLTGSDPSARCPECGSASRTPLGPRTPPAPSVGGGAERREER